MKDLLIYELKKITKKRLNIIVTLGSLVLTFIFSLVMFFNIDQWIKMEIK